MESRVYKDLIDKIDKISAFVVKCEAGIKPQSNEEIWLDSQEVANLLRISTRTLQRLRAENLISYAVLRGRCLYKLSEIERGLNERLIGYGIINNVLFKHLVVTRLFNPGSKLKTIDYLSRYQGITFNIRKIYRFLDNLCSRKDQERQGAKKEAIEHQTTS